MFGWLKELKDRIVLISKSIDKYKEDTVIQSLPAISYVNRAKKLIERNNFVEAEGLLLKALEITQKDALVYKYLGLVYEKTGAFELAIKNYQQSADINPNDKNIWQRLGFTLISVGRFDKAEKSFENANRVQPANTDTFTGWGMALMKMNKFAEAHDKFEKAVTINKYNFSAMFLSAVMEIKLELYDKAENKLAFLSNVAPNEGNTFEYARLKAIRDDFDGAIHYAKKSLLINPKMLPSYILLGQIYTKKLDKENAIKSFQTADDIGMTTFDFYFEWAKSLITFEEYEDAKEKLNIAYEKQPDNENIKLYLELCNVITDNNETFEIENSNNKTLNLIKGIKAYKNNIFDDAIKELHLAEENNLTAFYIAKCYEKLNNDIKTREYYETALNFNIKSLNTYINYVNYLISKNDYNEAQRKLRKALKYIDNDSKLLNLMFFVSYILVKDNFSEYNVRETLSIADKIEKFGTDLFEYPRQKEELLTLLSERE